MSTKDGVRVALMFKAMRSKVFSLLKAEEKLSVNERKNQQWQLLFQITGFGDYVVGKGGVNTMFYTVNDGERKLCLPEEMLAIIDNWCQNSSTKSYAIMSDTGKIVKSGLASKQDALERNSKPNYFIVSVDGEKITKLYVRTKGLFKTTWKKYER